MSAQHPATTPGGLPYQQFPHPFAGSNPDRQAVGDPGHCEDCVSVGHVRAHPDLGCGDVGCTRGHGPDDDQWTRPPVAHAVSGQRRSTVTLSDQVRHQMIESLQTNPGTTLWVVDLDDELPLRPFGSRPGEAWTAGEGDEARPVFVYQAPDQVPAGITPLALDASSVQAFRNTADGGQR